jgi:hypothetical protein
MISAGLNAGVVHRSVDMYEARHTDCVIFTGQDAILFRNFTTPKFLTTGDTLCPSMSITNC